MKLWRDAQLKEHGRNWKGKGKNREPDAGDDFWFLDKHANKENEVTGLASHNAAFGVADGAFISILGSSSFSMHRGNILTFIGSRFRLPFQASEDGLNQALTPACSVRH